MRALKHAESLKRHELKELFSDVYGGEEPLNLVGVPRSSHSPPTPSPAIKLARCDGKFLTFPHVLTEGATCGAHSTAQKVRVRVGAMGGGDEEVQG
jgi:hypothetical protein